MAEKKNYLKIKFHSFRGNACNVDVELPVSGKPVRNIRLVREKNGKLTFSLPKFLQGGWSYKEIPLDALYKRITEEYEKLRAAAGVSEKADRAAEQTNQDELISEPEFTFGRLDTKLTAFADIAMPDISVPFKAVFVQGNLTDNTVFVRRPRELDNIKSFDEKKWLDVQALVEKSFRKQFMNYTDEDCGELDICFYNETTFYTCLCNARIPRIKKPVCGFVVKIHTSGRVEISTPAHISEWDDKRYNLLTLKTKMRDAVLREYPVVSDFVALQSNRDNAEEKQLTPSGRIANAASCDFRYIPNSVLVDDDPIPAEEKKGLRALAAVMSKGESGGIGPYEIGVLKWVSKLRYATTIMIQELTYYGYIDTAWREKIKRAQYADLIKRMLTYDMLSRSHFGTLNSDGNINFEGFSVSKVLTMGPNGGMLIKELNIGGNRFNSFDTIRDAYTIKCCLAVNQWLIYWLGAYKDRIGDDFDNAFIIRRVGASTTAARLYAVVQPDDKVLVGEAVRRCAENAREVSFDALRNKLSRMIEIFDHPDEMYKETKKITYPSRPIINLICEDDEHIREVYEEIKDIMNENPQQKIWFTHDLRVFNLDNMGKRFISMDSGEPEFVDMTCLFGRDDELEAARLREMFTKTEGITQQCQDGEEDADGDGGEPSFSEGEYEFDDDLTPDPEDDGDDSEEGYAETEEEFCTFTE